MWRQLTIADIAGTLSAAELDAFSKSNGGSGTDPVADLLMRTANLVRSYIRTNKSVAQSSTPGTIPESLVSPACDYAAFDVLKRLNRTINEDRRRAREDAIALFDRVAAGKVEVEQGEEGIDAGSGKPETVPPFPWKPLLG